MCESWYLGIDETDFLVEPFLFRPQKHNVSNIEHIYKGNLAMLQAPWAVSVLIRGPKRPRFLIYSFLDWVEKTSEEEWAEM